MSPSCIMGSVCSAAPPQSQLWMSGDRGSCQPHSPGSGPLQRGVQCLAGAKGSQHTQLYQPSLQGTVLGLLSSGKLQLATKIGGFGPRGSSRGMHLA